MHYSVHMDRHRPLAPRRGGPGLLAAACLLAAVPAAAAPPVVTLEPALGQQRFARPLGLVSAPGDARHLYVVEQGGRIWRVDTAGRGRHLFADVRDRIDDGPQEAGLLGLAFHPGYAHNRRVFLSYTAPGDPLVSILAEYRTRAGGRLEADSERVLLRVAQPYGNHNGGHIAFGPDGFLYLGLGDGGAAGDPHGHGQNPRTLLGSLLRLDVDSSRPYAIPPDNPFASGGGRPEIWAFGLRNPWRFAFDPDGGALWLADVGQDAWEEIDLIVRGGNYGWNIREGAHCFRTRRCRREGLVDPVAEYGHQYGCSVTGGEVYRGRALPALHGWYLYADYCSGRLWGFDTARRPVQPVLLLEHPGLRPAAFGRGPGGELYVADHGGGRIFRLAPGTGASRPGRAVPPGR